MATNQNIHQFSAQTGRHVPGLLVPRLAVVEQESPDSEAKVVKTGRGLLFGSPRGSLLVEGKKHYKLLAPRAGRNFGDEVRAMFEAEGDGPRIVARRDDPEREVAYEGTVVNIGPRKYTITSRKAGDNSHLIHVRTGVIRAKGQSYEEALAGFFASNKVNELGFHGSFALDAGVENAATVEDFVSHLLPDAHVKWNVARTAFEREDGARVPVSREDAWLVPEGCRVLVVDPSIGEDGLQRSFTLRVENGELKVHHGGRKVFDQFMALEDARLKKRAAERMARRTETKEA